MTIATQISPLQRFLKSFLKICMVFSQENVWILVVTNSKQLYTVFVVGCEKIMGCFQL